VPPPPPPHKPTHKPTPGTLSVGTCSIDAGDSTCTFTIKAVGGSVTWRITGTSGVSASDHGTLKSGQTAPVTATKPSSCAAGDSGTGTVSFSPNGTASIPYTCDIFGN